MSHHDESTYEASAHTLNKPPASSSPIAYQNSQSSLSLVLTHNIIFFFLNDTAPPEFYTLPLPAALPIWPPQRGPQPPGRARRPRHRRSRTSLQEDQPGQVVVLAARRDHLGRGQLDGRSARIAVVQG